ncbi:hypothetical protein [Streptomyces sp. NPDC001348]
MKSLRTRLVVLAQLSAVIAVGLCGVQAASSQNARPVSVAAASDAGQDGDSGWGRTAPAGGAAVTAAGTDGDSGWGHRITTNETVTAAGTDGDSGWGRRATTAQAVTTADRDGDSGWGR